MQRLQQQNAQLQQRLDNFERGFQGREQQAQTVYKQQIASEVQQFALERDDKGKLLRPYVNEVRSLMGSIIGSGKTSDLKQAYDMACRADPEVFAKIEAQRRVETEREKAKKDREKATAANKAGASISGQPGDRARAEPTGDLREDMRRDMIERGVTFSAI